jgi:deoxyribonucleoside regulator
MARTSHSSDREMMRLVADLYYMRDLRQPEIAELTGFSISKVSRLLTQARAIGIVRISVEPMPEHRPALALELGRRLGVTFEVAPGREGDAATAARMAGVAAADWFVRALPAEGTVGVSAGYTVSAMATALPQLHRPDVAIVPVVGGWDTQNQYLDANELARRIGERIGGRSLALHAPAVLDSAEMRTALMRDTTVAAAIVNWKRLDLALLGVGSGPTWRPPYRTAMDRLGELTREDLVAHGGVGDIAGWVFDIDGRFVAGGYTDRMLAIPLDDLRRTPHVMAVAAGPTKVAALLGAVRTGIVHTVVTDRPTAEGIRDLLGPGTPA